MNIPALLLTALCINTMASAAIPGPNAVDTEAFATVLRSFVDAGGMVDYQGLKENPDALDRYLGYVSTVPEETVDRWSKPDRIAFYINAHNALTLKAVAERYPIKPSFFRSPFHPKNSVKQISGMQKRRKFRVHNRSMTLDHIKQKILRAKFGEPRVHMALVCGAKGCPPLRNEPYVGPTLDTQLADQTVTFLANLNKLKIDRTQGIVHLSPVFKWFGKDFVETYTPSKNPGNLKQPLDAVMNFVATHAEALFKSFLYRGKYKVKYLRYDWSLNEQ